MSEESLLVTLGVQDKGASTQIKALNKELKYLDNEFKTASKGSKDFETTTEGLSTKLSYLEKKYEANNTKLKSYKNQFDKASESVKRKEAELEKLKSSEEDNTQAIAKAEKQLGTYKDQMLNASRNINLTELEMKNLTKEINTTSLSIGNFKADQLKAKMEEVAKTTQATGDKINAFGKGMSSVGGSLMKVSAPFVALSVAAAKAEIDFETAFTGVRKTVDATDAQFAELEQGIKDMSKSMPESASNIAKVAEAAGQLGIKTENILGFTKTMVMLGDSTNMSSEEAATALAKLANITQMPQDKFQNLGSTIVALGNNLATTESQITEMGLRLAGAGEQIGLTEPQILSIAGALSSVGIEAEAGGSAFSKVMVDMQLATEKGGDSLNNFASVAGMSSSQFQQAFKEDAAGALISFVTGLQNTEKNGSSAIKVLDDMGITEVRMRDALLRAAGAGDLFSTAMKTGTTAWEENNALTNEASKRYETTASKIEMLKNKFKDVGIELGEQLLPYVTELMEKLSDLVEWFGSLDKGTQETIVKMGLLTFATGGLLKGLGSVTQGVGSIVKVGGKGIESLSKLVNSTDKLEKASKMASSGGLSKLGGSLLSLNPTTLAVGAGLAVVATGVLVAKKNADLMNESITYSTDEMSWLEKTLSKFNGTQTKTKDELLDSGLIYKDFSKNISPEFQKAVKQSTTDVNEFAFMLGEVTFDGVMSEEENAELNTRVDNALSNAIATIKGKQEESSKAMNELFMSDGTINENEQKILEFYSKSAETSVQEVTTLGAEIKDLQAKINASNSQEEIAQLEELLKTKYNRMKQVELEYVGSNAEEIAYAKNEFSARSSSIDLEDATTLMTEKAKLRNDEVVAIKAQYNTWIDMEKANLKGKDEVTRKAAEAEIEAKTKERDKKIALEQGLYEEYLNILGEKNPEILEQINKFNGEVMSTGDQKRAAELAALKANYEDINKATEDGLYTMYNSTTSTWDKVQVKVDSVTGEVVGMTTMVKTEYGYAAKETVGYTQQITDAMKKESNETIFTRNDIIKKLGEQIAKLEDVDVKADGTRVKIAELNGQKVEVQVSKDGTIRNLNEIINKISNIKDKTVTMTIVEQRRASQASQGYATGTINATKGFHLVGEEGPEIMYFNGGETVLTATQTRDVMSSGGYFNSDSVASRELISTTNNYSYNTSNSSGSNIDYATMAQSIAQAVAQAMQSVSLKGDVRLDSNAIVGTVSNGFAMAGKRVR